MIEVELDEWGRERRMGEIGIKGVELDGWGRVGK